MQFIISPEKPATGEHAEHFILCAHKEWCHPHLSVPTWGLVTVYIDCEI